MAQSRSEAILENMLGASNVVDPKTRLEKLLVQVGEKVDQAGAYGSPMKAATVAEMTDTNRVYVYTGSESGYTSGNWYYWNGTAWTSGGVYNAVAVDTDATLTESGEAADAKATGDAISAINSDISDISTALETKAEIDGYYEEMTVGDAEQLVATEYVEDSVPYLFRTTGGSADVGNREYMDAIVGGTVAWNQLMPISSYNRSGTVYDVTLTDNRDGSYTIDGTASASSAFTLATVPVVYGHKYYMSGQGNGAYTYYFGVAGIKIDVGGGGGIWNDTYSRYSELSARFDFISGTEIDNITITPIIIDLTQMFGSTIADYIYSLEQANSGDGVAWFRKLFPNDYYAYNSGELMSVTGLSSHDTVGFNQWDEVWELGAINTSGGDAVSTTTIRSKNYIPILPNTVYYLSSPEHMGRLAYYGTDKAFLSVAYPVKNATFTTPNDAYYMRFSMGTAYGTTYNNDICINLSWSGYRNGEYEEYVKHSYALDSSLTLRGIPKLDSSNNLYFDGDTYEYDGTVKRKYGIVDLGTLSWSYDSNLKRFGANFPSAKGSSFSNALANYVCAGYQNVTPYYFDAHTEENYLIRGSGDANGYVWVRNLQYQTSADFKAGISGTILVYELATPTTETADPYQQVQICDDFGIEEFVTTGIVPVGHTTRYPANLRDKLQHLPDLAESDGTYLITQSNKQMSLTPYSAPTGLPTAPTTDGTYTLIATVSDGAVTYSWEATS